MNWLIHLGSRLRSCCCLFRFNMAFNNFSDISWQCLVATGRLVLTYTVLHAPDIWAATWQNQQSDCASSEDSDQPGHLPSLIRVFAVRMKKAWVLSHPLSAQRRLWSDWADAQADLSLHWVHSHFVDFVISRLIWRDTTPSHIILTLGWPVLAQPGKVCQAECQVRSS